jgi:uncharacterized RDD family membrane protein YckC
MKKIKDILIETPEKIQFSYHIAEIGTRIAAYFIDELIQLLAIIIIIVTLVITGLFSKTRFDGDFFNLTAAFYMIMLFLLRWFYFVLFEVLMEGQSPGKKLMRIRVIREDGDSLDFETITLRNFLRAVDGFPVLPFTGGFVALIDSKNRRLGDIIANTIVVNEIQYNTVIPNFQVHFVYNSSQSESPVPLGMKQKLNEKELYIIRRFLNEHYKLPAAKQQEIGANLANQVRSRLGLEEEITNPLAFLERIYKQHGV